MVRPGARHYLATLGGNRRSGEHPASATAPHPRGPRSHRCECYGEYGATKLLRSSMIKIKYPKCPKCGNKSLNHNIVQCYNCGKINCFNFSTFDPRGCYTGNCCEYETIKIIGT